jgi:phosphinothricin acetyltransferase
LAKVQAQAPWLVCHLDGQVAGYAYASAHRDRAAYQWNREFSVYVDEAFRRRKVAHALYLALASLCAMQGYVNALAGIALPNEASVRFHESCGFVKAAEFHRVGHKLGRWHDVGWWEWRFAETDAPASIRTEWKPLLFSSEGLKAIQAAEAIIR